MRSFEGLASVDFMNMQKGGMEMNKMSYGLLALLMVTGILSPSIGAAKVENIPQSQAESINQGNGANTGGAANTVSGTGKGAGGPGDGQGPGNGAGQGIGNGSETSLIASSDADASPAPEPAVLVLFGVGGLLAMGYWLKKRSAKASHPAS